jgi:hypothetical protein
LGNIVGDELKQKPVTKTEIIVSSPDKAVLSRKKRVCMAVWRHWQKPKSSNLKGVVPVIVPLQTILLLSRKGMFR